jgi:hypothetical protein
MRRKRKRDVWYANWITEPSAERRAQRKAALRKGMKLVYRGGRWERRASD